MRIVRMLVLSGLLALPACSSFPTEPDVNGRSGQGSLVVPGQQQPGLGEPCAGMGQLARKCVRK